MADDIGHPLDVDVDHRIEFPRRHLPQRRIAIDRRRIVDQQIGRAVGLQHRAGPGEHPSVVGDIHHIETVRRGQAGRQFGNGPGVASAADDDMAEARKLLGHRPPEPARRTGDEDAPRRGRMILSSGHRNLLRMLKMKVWRKRAAYTWR